jgi:SAM-dependent methyltransferase
MDSETPILEAQKVGGCGTTLTLHTLLEEIRRVLKPGGLLLFDTVNCTPLATFVKVTMAERVLRLLPRGTHDPRAFIAPEQLRTNLEALDFSVSPMVGFGPRGLDRDLDLRLEFCRPNPFFILGMLGSHEDQISGAT